IAEATNHCDFSLFSRHHRAETATWNVSKTCRRRANTVDDSKQTPVRRHRASFPSTQVPRAGKYCRKRRLPVELGRAGVGEEPRHEIAPVLQNSQPRSPATRNAQGLACTVLPTDP